MPDYTPLFRSLHPDAPAGPNYFRDLNALDALAVADRYLTDLFCRAAAAEAEEPAAGIGASVTQGRKDVYLEAWSELETRRSDLAAAVIRAKQNLEAQNAKLRAEGHLRQIKHYQVPDGLSEIAALWKPLYTVETGRAEYFRRVGGVPPEAVPVTAREAYALADSNRARIAALEAS